MNVILALDPSFTAWGWAVVEVNGDDDRLVDCGTIRTKKGEKKLGLRVADDDLRRCQEIFTELERIWKKYDPAGIVTEVSGGAQSARASRTIGMTEGILASFIMAKGAPAEFYTALEAKMAATRKRKASKVDVQVAMRARFGDRLVPRAPKPCREAVCDALAVFMASKQGNVYRGLRR
jgi:Holliday junction resolvasome RuvABC endonuclease subunit